MFKHIVQKQNSMIALAGNNSIRTHERVSRHSIRGAGNQKSFVISTEPILASPSMIKIIMRFPAIYTTELFNIFTLFTNNNMSSLHSVDVMIAISHCLKQRLVKIHVYWLLVMKKYKIIFNNVISAIVKQCIGITAPRRVTEKSSSSRSMLVNPGPECVVVNFVYSNHV